MTKDEFDNLFNKDKYAGWFEYARKMKLACFTDFNIFLEGDGRRYLCDGKHTVPDSYIPKKPGNRDYEDLFHRNISFIDYKYTIRNNKKIRVVTTKQLHSKMYPGKFTPYDMVKTWYNKKLTTSLKVECGKFLINKNFLSKDIDEINEKIERFNSKTKSIKYINISDDVEMFIKRKKAFVHYIMNRSDILPCIKMKVAILNGI